MRKFLAILNTQIHHHLPREDHGWHHQPEVPASGLLAQLHSDLSPESGSLRRLRGLRTQTLQAILSNFLSVPAVLAVLGSTLLYIQTDLYLSLFISTSRILSLLAPRASSSFSGSIATVSSSSSSAMAWRGSPNTRTSQRERVSPRPTALCFTVATQESPNLKESE